jgi:hypothetical protein
MPPTLKGDCGQQRAPPGAKSAVYKTPQEWQLLELYSDLGSAIEDRKPALSGQALTTCK